MFTLFQSKRPTLDNPADRPRLTPSNPPPACPMPSTSQQQTSASRPKHDGLSYDPARTHPVFFGQLNALSSAKAGVRESDSRISHPASWGYQGASGKCGTGACARCAHKL